MHMATISITFYRGNREESSRDRSNDELESRRQLQHRDLKFIFGWELDHSDTTKRLGV